MCDNTNKNIYLPYLATVAEVIDETPDVRTLRLVFQDEQVRDNFTFRAGQFAEYSAFGAGEATFCIASSPTRTGYIECSFRSVGRVTEELRRLEVGDSMGIRGPYGNSYPLEEFYGKNLVFIAGGIALPLVLFTLLLPAAFKPVTAIGTLAALAAAVAGLWLGDDLPFLRVMLAARRERDRVTSETWTDA